MQINVLGIDHQCTAAVRELVAFTETAMLEFSSIIMEQGAAEAVILSTCNRSEVYYLLPGAARASPPAHLPALCGLLWLGPFAGGGPPAERRGGRAPYFPGGRRAGIGNSG